MQMPVFAVLLLISVTLGICVICQWIRASSFQCTNITEVITERPSETETVFSVDHEITMGGETSSFSGCDVCPHGWLLLNGMCYYFFEDRSSWTESDRLCRSVRANLATIKPSDIILTGYVKSLRNDFWIGLKKERRDRYPGDLWYWSDNTIEESIQEESSNFCVKIKETLLTESCSMKLPRICEREAEKC
ncbi:B-cell differentiation antigen CD72 isoform 1-T2 [Anomaloglossus baeobatrachus]|uniref:B-cell differentiation antigen CD72 n=1 Tax=Anomaloglossus baeobatrachus TaxID=238106 RepID=UPI003F50749C